MLLGTVKWFSAEKGFGYIEPEIHGLDVYVSMAVIQSSGLDGLVVGQRIGYETTGDTVGRPAAALVTTDITQGEKS